MAVTISPLELLLDIENPRFVVLPKNGQADIRKYLVSYEDVCQLASSINSYGSLLPGERIVVLKDGDKHIVVEGNRRTCSLQLLLARELIPDSFRHKIPATSKAIIENTRMIEVDVVPNREAALELMSKRHIEGVKQWRPIAKKQFFAANYQAGHSIQNLSRITGIKESEIRSDIKDYKLFMSSYNTYRLNHPDFNAEMIDLKIDPFLRVFKANFYYPAGNKISPLDVLKISYDNEFNVISQVDSDLFCEIVQLIFKEAIITEKINTRNVLTDVNGIIPLLKKVMDLTDSTNNTSGDAICKPITKSTDDINNPGLIDIDNDRRGDGQVNPVIKMFPGHSGGNEIEKSELGGPKPGGPPAKLFFETIRWSGKLDPSDPNHEGLLSALNELYMLSTSNCGRQKAYYIFPIATGMILRTVYEQALRLRLIQVGLFSTYCSSLKGYLPTLSGMENFIKMGTNKAIVLQTKEMVSAFDRVIAAAHRDFLNSNIHHPGYIRVAPDSLEGIACGGMFSLIQNIIDILP